MAETLLWTYQDAVEWVLDSQNANEPNSGASQRLARKAVGEAYRELANAHRWAYLERRYGFATVASYSTGTVAFDYTGGAYELMLTLTTGTWPSWAAFGKVIIDSVHYTVATRESDSIITLSPNSNPGADVASGETYTLYRDSYPLPVDFVAMRLLRSDSDNRELTAVDGDDAYRHTSLLQSPGDPILYAIHGDGEYYGGLGIHFTPGPSSADSFSMWYERSLRPLKTYLYSTGLVTVSASATTVTLATGSFSSRHVGCIIRFGDATNVPTSDYGTIDGTDNPYVAQRVITAVASTSSATIDSAASSSTLTSVKFTISDPLDLEHQAMLTAFLRMAEMNYARLTNSTTLKERTEAAQSALLIAKESDYRPRGEMLVAGRASGISNYGIDDFSDVDLDEVS